MQVRDSPAQRRAQTVEEGKSNRRPVERTATTKSTLDSTTYPKYITAVPAAQAAAWRKLWNILLASEPERKLSEGEACHE